MRKNKDGLQHYFAVWIAKKWGIKEAILVHNIAFWMAKNRANKKNLIEGAYWVYNTASSWTELIPYLTDRQIGHALLKLEKAKALKSGIYNKSKWDKTKWYTIFNKDILEYYGLTLRAKAPRTAKSGNSKCDAEQLYKTDNKPDNKPDMLLSSFPSNHSEENSLMGGNISEVKEADANAYTSKQLRSLCYLYFTLQKASPESQKANYGRVMKDIKKLSEMGGYEKVKQKLEGGAKYFLEKGLSWSTSAIIRQWDNIKEPKQLSEGLGDW